MHLASASFASRMSRALAAHCEDLVGGCLMLVANAGAGERAEVGRIGLWLLRRR